MQSVKNATKKNSNKIRNYLLRMNIEKNVNFRRTRKENYYKLGCVVRAVVDSILSHVECGPNDHRKDASPFIRVSILL